MDADTRLLNAYKEWRRLAEAEGHAIRSRNWLVAADCQKALLRLQSQIIHLTEEAHAEWSRNGADRPSKETNLRGVIIDLIEIERNNSTLLDNVRRAAEQQFSELLNARTALRQLQRSYATPASPHWTSLS